MTPQEALQQYHQRKAEIVAVEQECLAEKAKTAAFWEEKKQNLSTVETKKPYPCAECGQIIPEKTRVKIASRKIMYGGNFGLKTVYFCHVCRPIEKVTVEA